MLMRSCSAFSGICPATLTERNLAVPVAEIPNSDYYIRTSFFVAFNLKFGWSWHWRSDSTVFGLAPTVGKLWAKLHSGRRKYRLYSPTPDSRQFDASKGPTAGATNTHLVTIVR
ncbi:hypothetical protein VFPPC_02960 [Pochonia chlamydosporia 170]|uniref:Uncharacterized protein n=1 Tax=Pochonia chlamydosporia 170 TaxID=1380566 RepID=A0A179FZG0_METCM|nr:hypothetical protein VFPPC_02960 [Pochonia chlamydosporia 170]OAQ70501.1 hypothetical protein VFPPC_02960 [Pochonia chlamydosporia 170]